MAEHAVNIGRNERWKRMQFGIMMIVIAVVILALLFMIGANRWFRLVIAIPLWFGGLGVFQSREKT